MGVKQSIDEVRNLTTTLRLRLLETSEEFRLLHALEQVMESLEGPVPYDDREVRPARPAAGSPERRSETAAPSLRTAAYEVLADAGGPLPISAILKQVTARGVAIRSRNPRAALSSNLSQDARFECRTAEGRPVWALTETPPA